MGLFKKKKAEPCETKQSRMGRGSKFVISLLVDILGWASYAFPGVGEVLDLATAPLQAWWIRSAYNSGLMATIGFFEEILPFTDIIPSCMIAHFFFDKNKNCSKEVIENV